MARTSDLYLVSCVSKKLQDRAAAKDLYVSSWFLKARAYVESRDGKWFILSAQHGLVDPNSRLEPYEVTLNEMKKDARLAWAKRVQSELSRRIISGQKIEILAGTKYREFLEGWLRERSVEVSVPMKGLRIGEQLHWLTNALAESLKGG